MADLNSPPQYSRLFCQNGMLRNLFRRRIIRRLICHAEAAVKGVKSLITKCSTSGELDTNEFTAGMLKFRNTPKAHGLSPAQIVFGHPIRSLVPAHRSAFARRWQKLDQTIEKMRKQKDSAKRQYDKTSKPLKPIKPGEFVWLQSPKPLAWEKGVVVQTGGLRRYLVRLDNGGTYWRNRKFIRPRARSETACPEEMPTPNPTPDPTPARTTIDSMPTETTPRDNRLQPPT